MKIIIVSNTLASFLQHRSNLATELTQFHDLLVLIPESEVDAANQLAPRFRFAGFPIGRKSLNPFKEIQTTSALLRIYLEERPDLIHHFTIKPVIYGTIAARLAKVPKIINSITGLGYVFLGESTLRKLLKKFVFLLYKSVLLSKKVKIIFQNPDDLELFLENKLTSSNRSFLIMGSGVDTEKFKPRDQVQPNEFPQILVPSRVLWDKGIKELVEASAILKERGLAFEIILAGHNDPLNPSSIPNNIIKEWHEKKLINWIGFQNDMTMLYNRCDVVCLPSYREGVPMALLEAMASGKPIVTTDVPGCREVIDLKKPNGLLVEVKNSEALASALEKMIKTENIRKEMGQNSRTFSMNFSKEIINKEIMAIYE